ncbi:MAG TPA: glycosyltransferase family 39 protein [Vicinamibacterales bacterium]|nr:glycosyltransferase family 39 protein [Vicinamibacterales bacterium]
MRGRRLELVCTGLLLAFATWYWLQYFNRSTNLLDEGSTAAQALRIIHGDLIYRDFFTVVTPASYYTVASLFQIFGASLIVLRWTALVTGLAILLITLTVARRLMVWPFAAAAGLFTTVWGWFLVTPNFYSLEAALLSLIALACYVHGAGAPAAPKRLREGGRWIVFAGIATGLTALTKQNVGAYTAAGLFITIWASRLFDTEHDWRGRATMSAQFAGGVAIAMIPALIYLIAAGAGSYLYESWIYYPLVKYTGRFARPFPDFFPLSQDPFDLWTKLVIYLPVIVYPIAAIATIVLALRFQRRREIAIKHEGHALLAITIVGLLTLLQAWPRADVPHILFGLQPTFIVFAYLLHRGWRGLRLLPGPRIAVATIAMAIAIAPAVTLLWKGYKRTDWEYQNYIVAMRSDRAKGIFTGGLEAQRIDVVTKYLTEHTSPGDPIFVVPWASGFYFLADRSNPTRTDFMLFEDPEAYPCLLSRLEQRPPKYVIYGYTWDVDDKHFRDYAAPVDRYIRSRYAVEFSTDGYEIWRRLDEAPPATAAFPQACRPRRFRLRDLIGG